MTIEQGETEVSAKEQRHIDISDALINAYSEALAVVNGGGDLTRAQGGSKNLLYELPEEFHKKVTKLANVKHAARGAFLTLALFKMCVPEQDVRMCKSEHPNGFSARAVDTSITVPFLLKESLPRNVETHWLTQSFSFAEPWTRERTIPTKPKQAGLLLVDLVNDLQEVPRENVSEAARQAVVATLVGLIEERNRGRVPLTRPKNLTIEQTLRLLVDQCARKYKTNGPRIAQLIIYAVYRSLVDTGAGRFGDMTLDPLGRMKAADRKSGTVGDVVLSVLGRPVEAVETKMGIPVGIVMVLEAQAKIATVSVERYYILSTGGVSRADADDIKERCLSFRDSNGCEVIVDSLINVVEGYLRVLPSTSVFLDAYAGLMEIDEDLDYEHKVIWNEICATRNLV